MINIKVLQQYLACVQNQHAGLITNIFLANNENRILLSNKDRESQSSILSTLLNDSLFIIRQSLGKQQDLQLITESDKQATIIFSIDNLFIYGVSVKKEKLTQGHKLAKATLFQIKRQFKEVIQWAQTQLQ